MRATIHPFPARMAPELALENLRNLRPSSVVLDPMTGSGTVARQATELGHTAIGFDLDPLAVLISKVATTRVDDEAVRLAAEELVGAAREIDADSVRLPWIDDDSNGADFVRFWFGDKQAKDLRRLAWLLSMSSPLGIDADITDVLRVSLSRIIITKEQCASLARDTSHSRPHKVTDKSDYDVFRGFENSVSAVRRRMEGQKIVGSARIARGDARYLSGVPSGSVDAVLTSPPYLNAIDYLRGHRLSLIWFGHRHADLSKARSASIGSERRPDNPVDRDLLGEVLGSMADTATLTSRHKGMLERYIEDLHRMVVEAYRVLKVGAEATFVMGNSCLRGVYIENSEALAAVAKIAKFTITSKTVRPLPGQHRYLPTTGDALARRMREEIILSFSKA